LRRNGSAGAFVGPNEATDVIEMHHRYLAAVFPAVLLLAQGGTAPYSPGPPQVPGMRIPEQNPATTVMPPSVSSSSATVPASPGPPLNPGSAPPSPGLSFGAAPPPVVAPNR